MLSEHIRNATPSQIEALRQRKKFFSDLDKAAAVISVTNGTNARNFPEPTVNELHHTYLEPEPAVISSLPSQPIKARYFPGNAKSIVRVICKGCGHYFSVDYEELVSKTRISRIVMARQVAFVVTKEITGWSLPEIGRRFGGKDHTTVLHGMRKIKRLRTCDADFNAKIERLKSDVIEAIRADNPEFTISGERQRHVPEQHEEGAGADSYA